MLDQRSDQQRLAGTGELTWLALRRDRVMAPLWALGIAVLTVSTASSFRKLYPTVASRIPFAHTVETNSGLVALTGKPFDMTSIGGMTAWRVGASGALLTAIVSQLLVVRHTRAEEESNRLELLGSGVVGRFAPLTAALLTALIFNLGVLVLVALVLIGLGLPAVGSIALGLGFASCGITFAAVAAVSAQLTESGRAANGIGSALIGAAYLARAVGDSTGPPVLSWLSPIGWSQQLQAFAGERWWVPVMAAGSAGVIAGTGYVLTGRRDLGAGMLPTRPGPARAPARLRSAFALAWRLQEGALIGWTAGFVVLGAVTGGLARSVSSMVDGSPQLRDTLNSLGGRQNIVDSYLAASIGFGGIAAAAYLVQAVLRLYGEETGQRAEPLLATPTGRLRWALGHLVVSLLGTTVLLTGLGLAAGLADGARSGDISGQLPRLLGAALVQLFAVWVFAGVAIVLFGWAPKWTPASWGAVVAALIITLVGALLKLNHWLMDLSPFHHLPALPGGVVDWTSLAWLLTLIVVLCGVGLTGLHRRDLT